MHRIVYGTIPGDHLRKMAKTGDCRLAGVGRTADIAAVADGHAEPREGGNGTTVARMQLPETEIRAFRWVFEDEMDAHIYSLSARRLHRLLAGPTTIYTEDGRELD